MFVCPPKCQSVALGHPEVSFRHRGGVDVKKGAPWAGMSEAVVDDVRRDVGGQRHADGALWVGGEAAAVGG